MANKKIPLHQEIEKIRCELNLSKEQMCDILDLEEGTYDAFIARRRRLTVNQAISFPTLLLPISSSEKHWL